MLRLAEAVWGLSSSEKIKNNASACRSGLGGFRLVKRSRTMRLLTEAVWGLSYEDTHPDLPVRPQQVSLKTNCASRLYH